MAIKLKIDKGFALMLERIQNAGGDVDSAAKKCLTVSADIMQSELKAAMQAAGVDSGLINRMPPPRIEIEGNRVSASVGYDKGAFDPRNPSDAYKVVFANYGTPRRTEHGQQPAKGFIETAKKKAKPKIKKAQKETIDRIIGGLNG